MKKKLTTDLPLYIINSGLNIQNMHHGYANQLDVYTTILDILGINNKWLGLGHTLLSTPYSNSVSERTYELSEKIILGDFFKETHQ
jgi:phosphoglycerol transferase MdoB-like AlkP superfamily enzyme